VSALFRLRAERKLGYFQLTERERIFALNFSQQITKKLIDFFLKKIAHFIFTYY